ncbi:MAG: right-handed parallel beta-helix repeat-containing protein [Gemmatimonadales bacterium]
MRSRALRAMLLSGLILPAAFLDGRSGGQAVRSFTDSLTARPPVRLSAAAARCIRLEKAATQVSGEVKICPGRYRIPDHNERGVLVITGSNTRIDLTGVTLESGDQLPSEYLGIGILSLRGDTITIRGGRIRGYRFGVRLEGGKGHRVSGIDLSGSRSQNLSSTPTRYDERDWLNIFVPDSFEMYGAGLYLKRTTGVTVSGVIARGSQNGIGLFETRESVLSDNDVSGNSGWGVHLWRSSRNTIVRNQASRNVRCEGESYRRGCDSAALLLREESDSNVIVDNDLSWSGDGFFLSGQRPYVEPSIGNLVARNDASHSYHNAFEATFSSWNTFLDNRADSSDYGFWLGYSRGSAVRGNTILGSRTAAVAIEHGAENEIAGNTIIGGGTGIRLFAPRAEDEPSTSYRIDDNVIARVGRGIVLEQTTRSRLRGNLFDGVQDGLVVDSAGADLELSGNVFLSAQRWLIDAVALDAGGNFWGGKDPATVVRQIRGQVTLTPFKSARDAGY